MFIDEFSKTLNELTSKMREIQSRIEQTSRNEYEFNRWSNRFQSLYFDIVSLLFNRSIKN